MRMKKRKTKPRNFVAKYARRVNRAAVHRDRKKYYRKDRNWKKDVDKQAERLYNTCMKNKEINRKIQLLHDVAYYVLDSYGISPYVDIELIEPDGTGAIAYAQKDDDDFYCIQISKEHFEQDSLDDVLTSVCHEAVHVKQYVLDGLDFEANRWVYKGKRYNDKESNYLFYPWEVEARGLETAFAQTYIEENKIEHEIAAKH